ncbi:uncharacterized protein EAE97_008838 [Botrytis byssoidea]|uniref:NmrA-like domain-containing protein n=1 Tax=Botrytis byssoidea TaxID=139641 RepID=A0A9P5IFY8_9HELO|nr:uncharacterized protein EAE97_008838 [Botrytis byssoidea]KAF7933071.1 hypothetical protein EAE97_008838 [Botrytis byssoidea]
MTDKKLVVVLGATGAQGGPTTRYILKHLSHTYRVRAVTRDPTKPFAQALSKCGAEVISADYDIPDSIEAALSGAHAIFAITNFWEQNSLDIEVAQAKTINRIASKLPHLEHYILSSLPDGRALAGRQFQNILPYNAKALIRHDLAENYPSLWKKTTEVFVAFYFQNWVKYPMVLGPYKAPDKSFALSMPYPGDTRVPCSDAEDTGMAIGEVLRGGKKFFGRQVVLFGEPIPEEERLKIWADELGIKARFEQVSSEQHAKRLSSYGLPPDTVVASTELVEALPYEESMLTSGRHVQTKEYLPDGYNLATWVDYVRKEDWSPLIGA